MGQLRGVAASALLALSIAGCVSVGAPVPSPGDIAVPVVAPVQSLPPGHFDGGCALMPGTFLLVAHPEWGIAGEVAQSLRDAAPARDLGSLVKLYWPSGWVARRDGDLLTLLDETRAVVAYEGDVVYVGGNSNFGEGFYACSLDGIQRDGEWIRRPPGL